MALTILNGMQGLIRSVNLKELHFKDLVCLRISLVKVLMILVILFSKTILGVGWSLVVSMPSSSSLVFLRLDLYPC